jgi:hypothetical protein
MSRGVAGVFLVVAVLLIAFGLIDHYAKLITFQHAAIYIGVAAAVFGVIGIAGFAMKRS